MTMKDESSGYRFVFFLKDKSTVASVMKHFFEDVERQTGRKVISLRTDNGTEYLNREVAKLLSSRGITHEISPANVKQCNGMAERENRTLCDTARSMLFNTDLSKTDRNLLWTEAIGVAAYLRNRVPNRGSNSTTPYTEWYGRKPSVSHLRVFGSKAFVRIPDSMRKKMQPKSRKTIFVGYDNLTEKVYRVFNLEKKTVDRVSDVVIDDLDVSEVNLFPFHVFDDSERSTLNVSCNSNGEDMVHIEEEANEDINPLPRKRGRPKGSKNKSRAIEPTDRYLRSKVDVQVAMRASLDPISFEEVSLRSDRDYWCEAMNEEMRSLTKNDTWILEDLPQGRKAITCKWIYKSKLRPDGSLERRKARLVVRGFSQVEGVDYFETFAPVVRYETVRTVLAVAAKNMELGQFDVKTAFLYGPLEEVIYMEQPHGYNDGSGRVCRLKKGLYGLRQAPRNWNGHFHEVIVSLGFCQSDCDPCVYWRSNGTDDWSILCLYVDDGLIACNRKETMSSFMGVLETKFEIATSKAKFYIGMEISRDRVAKTIEVNQRGYIIRVLSKFGMDSCRSAKSPLDPGFKVSQTATQSKEQNCFPYREAIGCLNYIAMISRPDISFAVNALARCSNNPSREHWNAVKRVMRYLKSTMDISMVFGNDSFFELVGYCDSDYAGEVNERKSTSGYIFLLGGGPIAWSSTLQRVSALSSSEAEYMSISEAMKEILWLRPLLLSLGLNVKGATTLFVDNQAVIAMSKNPEFHKRTKHIGVRYHRVRQEQESGNVRVEYVQSEEQLADFLTKSLPGPMIKQTLESIGLR